MTTRDERSRKKRKKNRMFCLGRRNVNTREKESKNERFGGGKGVSGLRSRAPRGHGNKVVRASLSGGVTELPTVGGRVHCIVVCWPVSYLEHCTVVGMYRWCQWWWRRCAECCQTSFSAPAPAPAGAGCEIQLAALWATVALLYEGADTRFENMVRQARHEG